MAHILFMSLPDLGHVFPSVAVAQELGRRGHRITYLTGSGVSHHVNAPGVTAMPYDSVYMKYPKVAAMTRNGGHEILMLTVDESAAMLSAVLGEMSDDRPDAVAYDVATLHAGRILREKWGIPAIHLSPFFVQNENFSLAEGYQGEDGSYTGPSLDEMGAWAEKIIALVSEHGLNLSFEEFFMEPEKCNLVFVPREFQPHGDTFGPEFSFVGPCIGDRSSLPSWTKPDTDLPVVLVSLGTVFNREFTSFFKDAIAALGSMRAHVVMTVCDGVDIQALGPLPRNVEVHRWLSHVEVLKEASAFVCHGGISSLMDCFSAGKPVVMAQISPIDLTSAQQVRKLNLGRTMRHSEVTAERLKDTLADLLVDVEARQNAASMGSFIQRAGGTGAAADVTERFLQLNGR